MELQIADGILCVAFWSSGMILVSGARGPGLSPSRAAKNPGLMDAVGPEQGYHDAPWV